MDSRLRPFPWIAGGALFLVAYAQTTPLFSFFFLKPNIVLALSVILALSYGTFRECVFLVVLGAIGLASGVGVPQALLFFLAIFTVTRGILYVVPWQPLPSGIVLVVLFSFITHGHLAPLAVREALYNAAVFMALYACMPSGYARRQRIYKF